MHHKKKTAGGKIGPLEIVRFLLNSCCGVSQDDGTTPQSPREMLEFWVEATSLQHSLLSQTFLGSYSRAISQYIAWQKKKIDCTTCKGCAVVSKILYIPARDMMDPLFYHHPLSIQALPTRAHAQLNPFLRQIKVVMNNLLGSETCCPFISSSVDFWQNYLDSRSFWNPMRNSTQKGPLGKSHMNFSDATNEPRRKNGKLAIRFYSSTAREVPITGWFQKLLNRE